MMIDLASQTGIKGIILKEVINQRYAQGVREWLRQSRMQFTEQNLEHQDESENILFEIQLSEPIVSKQSQFYYNVLKKFYEVRKVINPQLSFESFLSQYRNELNEKIQRYKIQDKVDLEGISSSLNSLIISNESTLMKTEAMNMIRDKKEQIFSLEKRSEQVNSEYERLVKNLIQKNTQLNVENIQHQLKLKQYEKTKKQNVTKIYLPSKSVKHKVQSKEFKNYKSQQFSYNNEKKQEVQRIKVIVNNNMWGWGDKIHDRLKRLKSLQDQLQKS